VQLSRSVFLSLDIVFSHQPSTTGPMRAIMFLIGLVWLGGSAVAGPTLSPAALRPAAAPIFTLEEAVEMALQKNPDVLRAVQEIERTHGVVIEVRAQALPRLSLTSSYYQQDPQLFGSDVFGSNRGVPGEDPSSADRPPTTLNTGSQEFSGSLQSFFFQDKNYQVSLEVRQVLYSGGKVRSALKIGQLEREGSFHALRETVSRVINEVRKQFCQVLLDEALIAVREDSIRLLETELETQRVRFAAGTVPKFNVLRAEVELANAQPDLVRARNAFRNARLGLARLLALPADPITHELPAVGVRGQLTCPTVELELDEAVEFAKAQRSSLKDKLQHVLIESEQETLARAGYKPRLDASAGYTVRNSPFSDNLGDSVDGWFIGVQLTWDWFDGFETAGRIKQARARLLQARLQYEDGVRQVEFEVLEAWSRWQEARQLIKSQGKTVEQAIESLRLAREQFAAGAGTQLDILNARAALTTARINELQARFDCEIALADLDHATARTTAYSARTDALINEPRATR
jgi:outer membrane protein